MSSPTYRFDFPEDRDGAAPAFRHRRLYVVYAYSVFTHLTLLHIRKWVPEMTRVIKTGGHFIFTILSDTAVVALMPFADEALITQFSSQGGHDIVKNAQLDSINVSGMFPAIIIAMPGI